uniref:Uncharacterized protein n=1 Tax=Brassica oleracea TaxID=3712 RepID=A0A3P6G7Z6_BRAOL|nr:unnamed protein product [Brassica oleracea]
MSSTGKFTLSGDASSKKHSEPSGLSVGDPHSKKSKGERVCLFARPEQAHRPLTGDSPASPPAYLTRRNLMVRQRQVYPPR